MLRASLFNLGLSVTGTQCSGLDRERHRERERKRERERHIERERHTERERQRETNAVSALRKIC